MDTQSKHESVKKLISDELLKLCQSTFGLSTKFSIDALVGITLTDNNDVILVTVKESSNTNDDITMRRAVQPKRPATEEQSVLPTNESNTESNNSETMSTSPQICKEEPTTEPGNFRTTSPILNDEPLDMSMNNNNSSTGTKKPDCSTLECPTVSMEFAGPETFPKKSYSVSPIPITVSPQESNAVNRSPNNVRISKWNAPVKRSSSTSPTFILTNPVPKPAFSLPALPTHHGNIPVFPGPTPLNFTPDSAFTPVAFGAYPLPMTSSASPPMASSTSPPMTSSFGGLVSTPTAQKPVSPLPAAPYSAPAIRRAPKTSNSEFDMETHLGFDSESGLFKCKLCDHTSKWKWGVKRHVEARHLQLTKYKCRFCDRTFKHSSTSIYHSNKCKENNFNIIVTQNFK